jgi:formamidopyrimidine-DNA glycosylase
MPEGLEAEIWRRSAEPLVGRRVASVWCDERVAPAGLADALIGTEIRAIRRRGKVLLIDTDGPVVGLHFGMTGRLVVDGRAPIERLEYASGADRPEWDRLRLETAPSKPAGPALRMNDPRRLGRITLDPDLSHLGPDLLSVTAGPLGARLGRRRVAVKTALLDQRVVAGLGNLCADEVLFWAGVAPDRPADALAEHDLEAISAACRERLPVMLAAGGSTHGELSPDVRAAVRAGGAVCPLDGGHLRRASIDGRTAVWCGTHQR